MQCVTPVADTNASSDRVFLLSLTTMKVKLAFCHFCEIHGPSVIFSTKSLRNSEYFDVLNVVENQGFDKEECEGCSFNLKSLDTAYNGFVCDDHSSDSKLTSLSQNVVIDEQENNLLKHSCVRSLSCEVYPEGREGFIYFGDDRRGHVLSHTFVLKDSKARGFQRIYSILVIADDKNELLSNWDFFLKHVERIIKKLKDKANSVYDEELSQASDKEKRSIRLNVSQVGACRGNRLMNTQRSSSKARSLIDLTNNANIFGQLHSEFCWLINAAAHNKNERPVFNVELFSESQASCSSDRCSLRQLYNFLGKDKFRVAAYHSVVGHQIVVRSTSVKPIEKTIDSLSQLLPSGCVKKSVCPPNTQEDLWKYNFLGVLSFVHLPNNAFDSEFQLRIDITDKPHTTVTLHTKAKMPDRLPKYVYDLERVLQDMSYSDDVLDAYLVSSKEEWLNKAKMMYAYTKGIPSPRSQQQMSKFYQAITVQESDVRLLHFWSGGLSISFRANVVGINSTSSQFETQVNIKNVNTGT